MWQNSKTKNITKLKNLNVTKLKTQSMTKLIRLNFNKTDKLKLREKKITNSSCDKTKNN